MVLDAAPMEQFSYESDTVSCFLLFCSVYFLLNSYSDLVSKSSYPVKCGCHACEVVLAVRGPASWAWALAVDVSCSGRAGALIFSGISYLVGPGGSGPGGVIRAC